jgi:4-hydroxybenzoate polyprenyltransferase
MHASFLFLILSIRELTKDLENIKGDLTLNYRTIPIVYGEATSKKMISVLVTLTLIPSYFLITQYNIGKMNFYFYICEILLIVYLFLLWKSKTKTHYLWLHNILKFILLAGVLSIVLIDYNVVIERIL